VASLPAVASIEERVRAVRERIEAACARAGRDPAGVTLVAVSKTFEVGAIAEAMRAGVTDFGENRAQELVPKARAASEAGLRPRWHFIGHLQRNKARDVVPLVDALHSLDSVRLVEAVAAARAPAGAGGGRHDANRLACYIEVNVAGEAQKQGVPASEVSALLEAARATASLDVVGLMTVAPLAADPEQARPVFRTLRELAARHGLRGLSMGMTDDFEVAIEEGATAVRVGRAIFGARPA
jgi:pyridoxal phosphate enzyme (YggS family)